MAPSLLKGLRPPLLPPLSSLSSASPSNYSLPLLSRIYVSSIRILLLVSTFYYYNEHAAIRPIFLKSQRHSLRASSRRSPKESMRGAGT